MYFRKKFHENFHGRKLLPKKLPPHQLPWEQIYSIETFTYSHGSRLTSVEVAEATVVYCLGSRGRFRGSKQRKEKEMWALVQDRDYETKWKKCKRRA